VAGARGIPDPASSFGAQISPLRIGRLSQRDFGAARHLLDFALATNGLPDIIEFFGIDELVTL
jgi:hypothetical protein